MLTRLRPSDTSEHAGRWARRAEELASFGIEKRLHEHIRDNARDGEYDDNEITAAQITGDFFLEPADALADLEAALVGHPTDVDTETLVAAIEAVDADLIGFDATDLATVTQEALE